MLKKSIPKKHAPPPKPVPVKRPPAPPPPKKASPPMSTTPATPPTPPAKASEQQAMDKPLEEMTIAERRKFLIKQSEEREKANDKQYEATVESNKEHAEKAKPK